MLDFDELQEFAKISTAYEVSQNNYSYKNIQIHVQYNIVIRVINIIIRNVYLMDGNHIFGYTRLSSHLFHCIAASALILHLPRTFNYNRFLDNPTKYVIYYY